MLAKSNSKEIASVAVFRDGKLLYLKRRDNGKLSFPAGHLNPGEEPIHGAERELFEETGLNAKGFLHYLGQGTTPNGLTVYSFTAELPEGVPTSANDPDKEASEFQWLDEVPANENSHVPHSKDVTLKLLGLVENDDEADELSKKEGQKEWRAKDGLKIPHYTSPARSTWDKGFLGKLVDVFAYGNPKRFKKIQMPVTEHGISGHFVGGAVGPGGRDRRSFYSRMLAGGDKLPPIVVKRNGIGWHVIDGNARLTAAHKHGLSHMDAYELVD